MTGYFQSNRFSSLKPAYSFVALFFLISSVASKANAQCITTYPFVDDFESGNGGWVVGGNSPSWLYGTPNKSVISSASSGTMCWNSGGLGNGGYNSSEQSYIESPCFDLSSLSYPAVSFRIFWETEFKFDGGNFQSSVDGGNTWVNVGAFGDIADCNTQNWFNHNPITYLNNPSWISVRHGWSGTIQPTVGSCQGGNGSGQWLTAKHCLTGLANQPSVKFRFTMAAGSICNNFNGISIDDFSISDGQPNQPDFTFVCNADGSFSFTAINPCPGSQSWSWNFGDIASGASNTASTGTVSHTFSSPGDYIVTLSLTGGNCNPPGSISKTIRVLGASISSIQHVSCFGGTDGSAQALVSSGFSPFSYTWSNGSSSANAQNLSAGNYSLLVSDSAGCIQQANVQITQPSALTITVNTTDVGCGNTQGNATAIVGGGQAPYSFAWSANPSVNANTIAGLDIGNYSVVVNDANNCQQTRNFSIQQQTAQLTVAISATDSSLCLGQSATLSATVQGGSVPYQYNWSSGGSNASIVVSPASDSLYSVEVNDASGCSGNAQLSVSVNEPPVILVSGDSLLCANDSTTLTAVLSDGQMANYNWNPGNLSGNAVSVSVTASTTYTISSDILNGCQPSNAYFTVTVIPPSAADFWATDTAGCTPFCTQFQSNIPFTNCLWSFGDGFIGNDCQVATHCYEEIGQFNVQFSGVDTNGCLVNVQKNNYITTLPAARASFSYSPFEIEEAGEIVNVSHNESPEFNTAWYVNGVFLSDANPTAFSFPAADDCAQISLTLTSTEGCTDSTSAELCITPPFSMYAPNAFSPDGNEKNEVFRIKGVNIPLDDFDLIIYNRWGEQLFRTRSPEIGWDGTYAHTQEPVQAGVYVYSVQYRSGVNQNQYYFWGRVTLIR